MTLNSFNYATEVEEMLGLWLNVVVNFSFGFSLNTESTGML